MAEWSIAPVLKTGDPQGSVGSNPTPSARLIFNDLRREVHPYRNAGRNMSCLFHYIVSIGIILEHKPEVLSELSGEDLPELLLERFHRKVGVTNLLVQSLTPNGRGT